MPSLKESIAIRNRQLRELKTASGAKKTKAKPKPQPKRRTLKSRLDAFKDTARRDIAKKKVAKANKSRGKARREIVRTTEEGQRKADHKEFVKRSKAIAKARKRPKNLREAVAQSVRRKDPISGATHGEQQKALREMDIETKRLMKKASRDFGFIEKG